MLHIATELWSGFARDYYYNVCESQKSGIQKIAGIGLFFLWRKGVGKAEYPSRKIEARTLVG